MNNVEAKFILQAFRTNGGDADDATFRAALDQAQRDAELREWWAREQAFDRAMRTKLNEIPAPAGLREAILAGGRATAPATARRSWWLRPVTLAAAASFALLLAVGLALFPKQAVASPTLVDFVSADAVHDEAHGGSGQHAGALQAALARTDARLGTGLAVDFEALRTTGCRKITFQGHDVLEVCFKRNGIWFHCYVVKAAGFPSLGASTVPVLKDLEGASLASWVDGGNLFFVVSKAGRQALQQLL